MFQNKQLITVILAVLNASNTLERCLQSILKQTYQHKEIILVDGGSTDGTLSILDAYGDKLTYWESKPDRGIYHAWNKALKHARGDWICFLGADDYFWSNNVLADLAPHLIRATNSGIRIVYGQAAKVDKDGRIIKLVGKSWKKIHWLMRHGMPLIHSGIMHHRNFFHDHGLFDESFVIAGDYEFLLRELRTGHALFADDVRTVDHQAGGLSDSRKIETLLEIERARRMHGLPGFSWVWTAVYIRTFLEKQWRKISDK